jgi:cysteine-rich CPCC protein/DinB family protein
MNLSLQTASELPPDLKAIVDVLDNADREARQIMDGLSDEQANWRPQATAWSIAQCLDHLTRATTQYAVALQTALDGADARQKPRRDPIRPGGWVSGYFIRSLEPPPKQKMRAPKKIVPAQRIGRQEVLDAFLHSNDDMKRVVQQGAPLDLNRIRFHNPFFGFLRLTVGSGLLITAAHVRRHLWQAEQVRQSAGFPAARRLFQNVSKPEEKAKTYRCPCCRCRTLHGRGADEICKVCFWEDDGQDDHDADEVRGGPNRKLSLTQARRNFTEFGASDRRWLQFVRKPLPDEM